MNIKKYNISLLTNGVNVETICSPEVSIDGHLQALSTSLNNIMGCKGGHHWHFISGVDAKISF